MQSKYPKEVDKYIHRYIIMPYRIEVLNVYNNHHRVLHGRDNKKIINEIKELQAEMQMIYENINHEYFKHLDLLFRYSSGDVSEKLGIKVKYVTTIRTEIRGQFYELMKSI